MRMMSAIAVALFAMVFAGTPPAWAQDVVKIGLIVPLTGPFTSTGKQLVAGARLYMQLHGDVVAGKKIELVIKDDAGTADLTKRLAQELVVNDKVAILAGFGLTPGALATSWRKIDVFGILVNGVRQSEARRVAGGVGTT
jgi:branched-chain amino acid transport system substrate-binding protein